MMEQGDSRQPLDAGGDGGGLPFGPGLIGFAALAIVSLVFVFQNTGKSKVTFLIFDAEPPLWVALLIAVFAGIILGELGGWLLRRRKSRKQAG